jgi:hypothetical protein
VLVVAALMLGTAAPAAGQVQDNSAAAPATDAKVYDPDLAEPVEETTPEATPANEVIVTDDAAKTEEDEEEPQTADKAVQQPGWGNARDQKRAVRLEEANQDCRRTPPPTSSMLGYPGTVAASEGDPISRLLLIFALGALLVAGVAYLIRRKGKATERGSLETVSTILGILGAVAGLAVQFVPGIGVHEKPLPAVSMKVRDITPRIRHAEYARKTHSKRRLRGVDGREVGNVIWLEIHLEGYQDKELTLQYASFDPEANHALLPGTAIRAPLPHGDDDAETQFVPIWVGYPLSEKFEAAFRLLEGGRVQALAQTSEMRSSKYRYSCR